MRRLEASGASGGAGGTEAPQGLTPRTASRSSAAALLGTLLALACHGERDEARRVEAGGVVRAVEALRGAPSRERAPFLKALAQTPCGESDVCALKKSCADAYGIERRALESMSAVRRAATGTEPVSAQAGDLLSRVESDLARFREESKACADLEAKARRRYAL